MTLKSLAVWFFGGLCAGLWYLDQHVFVIFLLAGHIALNGQGIDAFGSDSFRQLIKLREDLKNEASQLRDEIEALRSDLDVLRGEWREHAGLEDHSVGQAHIPNAHVSC